MGEHGRFTRRGVLRAAGGVAGAAALGAAGTVSAATAEAAAAGAAAGPSAGGAAGLEVVERDESDPRMWRYRFRTAEVSRDPGVSVLLPEDYHVTDRVYPVLHLLHGGGTDQDHTVFDRLGIRELAAGLPLVVVMPDGGAAGWYSDPVSTNVGPRNWETFHVRQLLPWVEGTFRTHAERGGRAVAGFSMGGFGALKHAARYPELFASVSSHSGPASLRRDLGLVVHWANLSSAVAELGGGTVYGAPEWDQARVTADNPVEQVEKYRDMRVFLVAGDSPDQTDPFGVVNEVEVLAGQREFRGLLDQAGIPYEAREEPGGHVVRPEALRDDLAGVVAHLLPAA